MAQKPIREVQAKELIHTQWVGPGKPEFFLEKTDVGKCVAKVDELFGKRGKRGYVKVAESEAEARQWVDSLRGKEIEIDGKRGVINHFIIEPYIEHKKEYYLAFTCDRDRDVVLFSKKGGVEIEDQGDSVIRIAVALEKEPSFDELRVTPKELHDTIRGLLHIFRTCDLGYLEINPLVYESGRVYLLDAVCRVDSAAAYRQKNTWGTWDIPDGFGTELSLQEKAIHELDNRTGSSLKFVLLNPKGRIWTMVAGGGASIIYADAITNLAPAEELANYGEWSGNPSTDEMEEYTKNILELMTSASPLPEGGAGEGIIKKALIIGGGIANFTDIKKTFTGVIRAFEKYQDKMRNIKIYVRRAGPNDVEGLQLLQEACDRLGIACETHGAEVAMTSVVEQAVKELGVQKSSPVTA
ncbi:ATPase [Candidatus Peregrinibacteria bacterium CG10_big_fil_rev_8_21_14_0_10_49_16]|nr:MAG: ATPase [Candidatus Peregrinibacteria bacterium CG22_combo_CG10-13_8_21_14_all_49_11]PIR52173.1 MAG: ATPase [Candidatus Peregrinibacteria bacterium CG10_big_fil_rev_8_21_14_0_10_49_16]